MVKSVFENNLRTYLQTNTNAYESSERETLSDYTMLQNVYDHVFLPILLIPMVIYAGILRYYTCQFLCSLVLKCYKIIPRLSEKRAEGGL